MNSSKQYWQAQYQSVLNHSEEQRTRRQKEKREKNKRGDWGRGRNVANWPGQEKKEKERDKKKGELVGEKKDSFCGNGREIV